MMKKCIWPAMMIGLILMWFPVCSRAAVSADTRAKNVYAGILQSKGSLEKVIGWGNRDSMKFALVNIDNSGAEELIVTPDYGYHMYVLAYVNNKVKKVAENFCGCQRYYPGSKLFYSDNWHGTGVGGYYRFNGKKMTKLCGFIAGEAFDAKNRFYYEYSYYIGSVETTKVSYRRYVKRLVNGAKEKKIVWRKNTAGNRKKYL